MAAKPRSCTHRSNAAYLALPDEPRRRPLWLARQGEGRGACGQSARDQPVATRSTEIPLQLSQTAYVATVRRYFIVQQVKDRRSGVSEWSFEFGCGHAAFGAATFNLYTGGFIRVSFVIPTLDQSGAERQMTLLATSLARLGQQVNVIALNRGGYFESTLAEAGVRVSVLQKRFRFDPLTWHRLRRELRQTDPDIIQSFLFSANAYVRMPGVASERSRVIVSERCVDSWKSGWQLKLDRWQRNRMKFMTANSESVADFYHQTVGVERDRIRVIPNGIPAATDDNRSVNLRAELGQSEDTLIVGFVGRLAAQKRLQDLLWAYHLLHQVVENVVLVIVGDGPDRDSLAEFSTSVGSRHGVFFTGHRSDASDLIRQFDVLCLPSSFEGMSNSLMEAMACGTPAVVSDIPSNKELVTHEETGLVFPCGDSAEICRMLKRMLVEKDTAQKMSDAAAAMVQQKLSVEQMVQSHQTLYDDALAE